MDGLEALALAYGWSPEVGRDMSLGEFAEWVERAMRWIKARGATRV